MFPRVFLRVLVAAATLTSCAAPQPTIDLSRAAFPSMEEISRRLQQAQALERETGGCERPVQARLNQRQRTEVDDVAVAIVQQGLAQCRKLGDRRGERLLADWLGHLHFMRGDYRAAADAQHMHVALADDIDDRINAWDALGRVHLAAGEYADALKAHRTAFDLAGRGDEPDRMRQAQALRGAGLVFLDQRNYAEAQRSFERALALAHTDGVEGEASDQSLLGGPVWSSLAVAQLRAGRIKAAEASLRRALEAPEAMNAQLAQAERQIGQIDRNVPVAAQAILSDMRPMLRDWMPHAAPLMVDGYACSMLQDLLVAQQRAAEALEVSEGCRGRALVQRLALRALPQEAQPPTIAQIRSIAKQRNATLVEYTIVYEPSVLPDWIPDKEVALLAFVVTPDGVVSARRVPLTGEFGTVVRSVAELVDISRAALGARGRGAGGSAVAAPQGAAKGESRPRQLHRLLIAPIADLLPRDPDARVIFVPQESLFLVPFAALRGDDGRHLIDKHTIAIAPSLHTLDFTQRQRRPNSARASGERVLIVGNPAMPSYPPAPGLAPEPLPDLPDAELEAKAIAQLRQAQPLTGKQATKAVFKARLAQARIIHLATHGLLDDLSESRPRMPFARYAALSSLMQPGTTKFRAPGSLALAPDAGDSGLLTADEIAQLRTSAQLVVMSACDTGRGTILGDGVVGLTRSWIAAGVPSVVSSLWAVPDEPTSELMVAFHRQLAQRPDKAWALRQAMLQTKQRHPDPINWAAFVLIGEAD